MALRNHPQGSFENQHSSGCSFHPTTQKKSRGQVAECPVLPFPFACLSAPSWRGPRPMVHGRSSSGCKALELSWPDPCHHGWFGWGINSSSDLEQSHVMVQSDSVNGSVMGRSWLLSFRENITVKKKKQKKKAMSFTEDKQTWQSKINPFER